MPQTIHKILIANRGEIACRIIHSAKKLGIKTMAVYSEVDRTSKHVLLADEAICIGPAPAAASYLNSKKLIQIAIANHVDAIHPGYGFLSENSTFAKDVTAAGICFIGPTPKAIERMGDKITAKNTVSQFEVPLIPGSSHAISSAQEAQKLAEKMGYPVLIKASAGGGGKGMRIVHEKAELPSAFERAQSEAANAFGDPSVFIEKFITKPRHIEIQILGDLHGNVVYLFERECSIQRRHQKVIEEAPAAISQDLRSKMGKAAVEVAKACQYHGAGTVEFIVDEHEDFYFLEMNTRLQVEHPVTEFITGVDLVEAQIRVAEGLPLSIKQEDLQIKGHAIEARVYAEDPFNQFLPDVGALDKYEIPKGDGIRVDDGYLEGMEIPVHYDPLIAKLICYGADRKQAIERMDNAINKYIIEGVATTLSFCQFVMNHPVFVSEIYDTNFVGNYFDPDQLSNPTDEELEVAAIFANFWFDKQKNKSTILQNTSSKWQNRGI